MKITSLRQIPASKVEMDGARDCQIQLAITPSDGAPNFAMRVFEIAPGGHTPHHRHPYEYEVYVIEGQGAVWREGREVPVRSGDILYVPADEPHQFKNVGGQPFRFVCLIPAKFQQC